MRLILIAVAMLCSLTDLFAAPLPRVGDTIDVAERDYFKLFPFAPDYQTAFVADMENSDSTALILVIKNSSRAYQFSLGPSARKNLDDYLTNYEAVALGRHKIERAELQGVVVPIAEAPARGANLTIRKMDGTTVRGRLFNIDSDGVVVADILKTPNWDDSESFTSVSLEEIRRVNKHGIFTPLAIGAGFLCGAYTGYLLVTHDSNPNSGNSSTQGDGSFDLSGIDFSGIVEPYLAAASLGLTGAFVGFMISRINPSKVYRVNGSKERMVRTTKKLEDKASSRVLPPELDSLKTNTP